MNLTLCLLVSLGLALTIAAQPWSLDNESDNYPPNKQFGSIKSSRIKSLDKTMIQTGGKMEKQKRKKSNKIFNSSSSDTTLDVSLK